MHCLMVNPAFGVFHGWLHFGRCGFLLIFLLYGYYEYQSSYIDQISFPLFSLRLISLLLLTLRCSLKHEQLRIPSKMSHFQPWCLKITEKVAFSIVSKASYFYILSGQKFAKNAKMVNLGEFLKSRSLWSRSVTRQGKNLWKMPNFKHSNATFRAIFIQCVHISRKCSAKFQYEVVDQTMNILRKNVL